MAYCDQGALCHHTAPCEPSPGVTAYFLGAPPRPTSPFPAAWEGWGPQSRQVWPEGWEPGEWQRSGGIRNQKESG